MSYQSQRVDLNTRTSWDWMTEMEQLPRFETRY